MNVEGFRTSFRFPHTSHTFSLASPGTAKMTFMPFVERTLSLMALEATETSVTCRSDGYECTTMEFTGGAGISVLGILLLLLLISGRGCVSCAGESESVVSAGPGPCVLRISLQ